MPERGPAQLLLLSLRVLARSGWRVGLAASLVALLGLLPREEGVYHQAKSEFAQSLRQAAWDHAIGGDQARPAWPWDKASAAVAYSRVPRLGLSATIEDAGSGDSLAKPPVFKSPQTMTADRQDPHLQLRDDDLDADDTGLTGKDQLLGLQVGCPAAGFEPGARDPHLACPRPDLSLTDALRLIIESGKLDKLKSQATSDEQKL